MLLRSQQTPLTCCSLHSPLQQRPACSHVLLRQCMAHQAIRSTSRRSVSSPYAKTAEADAPLQEQVVGPSTLTPFRALQGKEVYLVSEQRGVDITSLWSDTDAAVIFWARSMGCFFCQELARELRADVLPKLEAAGVKAFLVTIGTAERGLDFAQLTGFPTDRLLADPEARTYAALELRNDIGSMFFNVQTPLSIGARIRKDGAAGLRQAIGSWKPWIPPKEGQSRQQGGCLVFGRGRQCVYEHRDVATGAHADLDDVVQTALLLADA